MNKLQEIENEFDYYEDDFGLGGKQVEWLIQAALKATKILDECKSSDTDEAMLYASKILKGEIDLSDKEISEIFGI